MQIEIDKLTVQITVCYEKIGKRDTEIRKLLILCDELKEWKEKYEIYQKQVVIEIKELRVQYEKTISDLKVKLEQVTSDYERLKKLHDKCPDTIYRLEHRVTDLEL